MPDGVVVGTYAAAVTDRLGFLLSHRPGFAAPTVAARQIATLDHVCGGRLALHLIAGSTDQDQQRDGDYLSHADRYRRMAEYAVLLKRAWTEPEPFDFEGEFYRMSGAWSAVRCLQSPHVPIYGGGGSEEAPGNSTCLVGTPDTVAEALAAYFDLGATTLLIRGWDPLVDAQDYGRELIPRVRELVAKRDSRSAGKPGSVPERP